MFEGTLIVLKFFLIRLGFVFIEFRSIAARQIMFSISSSKIF